MKRSPLPLLMGAIIGTQALLNGLGAWSPAPSHHDGLQKLLGISAAYAEEAAAVKYTCPMHPQIISDTPGKCPICGMDLVPLTGGHHNLQQVESGAPVVEIAADTIQKMGVRIDKVSKGSVSQGIRATGIVMPNERTRQDMFSQVEGRVDELKYNAVGDRVKKGDVFYTLYSPELLALQNDYIAAKKAGLNDLANAAGKRMKLLGVDDKVIATLAKTGQAYDKVPFYIPADGILAKLEIRKGHYLKMGDEIGHVQDLSSVWVEAAIAEQDIGKLKEGDAATVRFTGDDKSYDAKLDYIYPTLNAEARTGKARLVVENKNGSLRPAGYATVEFAGGMTSDQLTVPSEAILRSSEGEHVIIALGNGKFQSRSIKPGAASGGRTEILDGLKEGEDVVTSAQFLIDSESSLRESLQKLTAPEASKQSMPGMPGMEMNNGK